MTNIQRQAVELTLLHPKWTDRQICQELNKSPTWICNLKKTDEYKAYLKERMQEIWADAGKQARQRMIELVEDPNAQIAYKAAEFILKSLYPEMNPATKIDAHVDGNIYLTVEGFEDDSIEPQEISILS